MRWLLPLFLICGSWAVHAEEVIRVTWKTTHAAAPPQFSRPTADFLPMFRLALSTLPESAIVALALSQPAMLGLTPAQAGMMRPLVAERYALIAKLRCAKILDRGIRDKHHEDRESKTIQQ